jgi:hypothetical protein
MENEMLVSFELSMPGNNSWNGKWSGEGRLYCRIKNVGTTKGARAKWEKLIGHHHYRWSDGWAAMITVREVTSSAARKLRKDSKGFCGYEWMIDSLARYGKILAGDEVKTVLEFEGEHHALQSPRSGEV